MLATMSDHVTTMTSQLYGSRVVIRNIVHSSHARESLRGPAPSDCAINPRTCAGRWPTIWKKNDGLFPNKCGMLLTLFSCWIRRCNAYFFRQRNTAQHFGFGRPPRQVAAFDAVDPRGAPWPSVFQSDYSGRSLTRPDWRTELWRGLVVYPNSFTLAQ